MSARKLEDVPLTSLMPKSAREVIHHSGIDYVESEGLDNLRETVFGVYRGENVRYLTEAVTRDRIQKISFGIEKMFENGIREWPDFASRVPEIASERLRTQRLTKAEKWLCSWVLGLTQKSIQNVIRDDPDALHEYGQSYVPTMSKSVRDHLPVLGDIYQSGIQKEEEAWLARSLINATIGCATMAIRGSDKSTFGKLFEKLILGPLLETLGYSFTTEDEPQPGEYHLSSRGSDRESDATLVADGHVFRFDIGFIGRGNPEIVLDKVTRFRRQVALHGTSFDVSTVILADRIGDASRIRRLAREVGGYIVTMNDFLWPMQVLEIISEHVEPDERLFQLLSDQVGFEAELRTRLDSVAFKQYIA